MSVFCSLLKMVYAAYLMPLDTPKQAIAMGQTMLAATQEIAITHPGIAQRAAAKFIDIFDSHEGINLQDFKIDSDPDVWFALMENEDPDVVAAYTLREGFRELALRL